MMDLKSLILTASVALTAFLLVGGAVTAIFEQWIEFSLFVGIPVGLLAGVLAAGGVAMSRTADSPDTNRRIARLVSGFSIGFLGSIAVLLFVWNGGVVLTIGVSIAVGLLSAVLFDWRNRTTPTGDKLSPTR